MSLRELGLLVALGALWGASFIFIRVSVGDFGPFALVELRVGLAALALALYAFAARKSLKIREMWPQFLLLGGVNAASPFILISSAELKLTASFGAILNSTTPLFGALVAAIWIGESLTVGKVFGLLLGITGVTVLVGWSPMPLDLPVLFAVVASLGGALCYGVGSVYAKKRFHDIPSLGMAVGQLGGAAVVTLPFAAASAPVVSLSGLSTAAVLALALLSTALAYLIYFRLISSVGPTKTMTVTFVVPVFGVLLGALLLGEPVGGGTLPGLAIILLSLLLVNEVRLGRVPKPSGG